MNNDMENNPFFKTLNNLFNPTNENINQNSDKKIMTDSLGRPINDDNNSLTVGENGPVLIEDFHLIDKISHFDRERIPERVVHAKGVGAFGTFVTYQSMAKYTCANFLNINAPTKVLVRFSTVIGGRGSADTVRDPRGFAVKFYTNQGIYDLVGNNLPVFFIRDAIKFPDVIHSLKPDPVSNLKVPERFWDFISLSPESTHMITWLYSDRGTIKDYRHTEGFGVNTYIWVNSNGERNYVKYHWKTLQGNQTISRQEATRLSGEDPDIAVRLLHDSIEKGNYPKWELNVQIMNPKQADQLPFDPLDDTKTWSEEQFPLIKVGLMTLNQNPKNFFAEIEQSAFCPGNTVPGIELSADKMLQGRSFSYVDTQRYRIGPNFAQLPVNRSISPVDNNQSDGLMTIDVKSSHVNYYPNSLNNNNPSPTNKPNVNPVYTQGYIGRHPIKKTDDYTQAGERYRSFTEEEKNTLCDNVAVELVTCNENIVRRVLNNFSKADTDFATRTLEKMKLYR